MKVAILGHGTVGSGVFDVLTMNSKTIEENVGQALEIKYVLDLREFPGQSVEKVLVHDFDTIVNDPEVEVVAEVMGGLEPAYTFTKRALEAGKAVCTSNKELVSRKGAELLAIAKAHKTNYIFEASVGGGIPILRPLHTSLTADQLLELRSIINGTTNYILTRMRDEGLDFDVVLKAAQDNGFAERNPAADIEGLDAARKTAIFASLVNRQQVECDDIYTEGITKITPADITYAAKLGKTIRLISLVKRDGDKNYAMVAPFLIGKNCQLYNVDGVFNAVLVKGNAVGDLMFYGSGAGKLPTASAVVSDMVEAAKCQGTFVGPKWAPEKLELADRGSLVNAFFVRVAAGDEAKARQLFTVATSLDAGISGEFAFVTEPMTEADFEAKASQLDIIGRIRCEA